MSRTAYFFYTVLPRKNVRLIVMVLVVLFFKLFYDLNFFSNGSTSSILSAFSSLSLLVSVALGLLQLFALGSAVSSFLQ